MAKIKYNDIWFDSQLEIDYYNYLHELMEVGEVLTFEYHPKHPIQINQKNKYTPDFIVEYDDTIVIVETKGYNQYSYMRDSIIHNFMQSLTKEQLKDYVELNGWKVNGKDVIYKKIKYLKAYGFVDFDFKNPNSIDNQRKNKIAELQAELKEYKQYQKDCERWFGYYVKKQYYQKLTKKQEQWYKEFEKSKIFKINHEESE